METPLTGSFRRYSGISVTDGTKRRICYEEEIMFHFTDGCTSDDAVRHSCFHDTSIDEHKEDDFIGTGTSNAIFFMIDKKGKLTIKRHNNMKDKWVSMGSASVKAEKVASGKYYLVTIKDMPYDNTYMPRDADWRPENAKSIPTNKTFQYDVSFNLQCDLFKKAVKDCFYLVSSSCNTGVKTLNMNFTGNFRGFHAWHNIREKELPVTMKISRVSF